MGFQAGSCGGRAGRGRRNRREAPGDGAHRAPRPRASRREGKGRLGREGRIVPDRGDGAPGLRRFGKRDRSEVVPAVAGAEIAAFQGTYSAQAPAHHGAARHRHPFPAGERRDGRRAGRLRHGQDDDPARARQMVRRRHHRLHRMRRARERDDRRAHEFSRADRSAVEAPSHGAHDHDRQHVEYAGGGARGLDLHGNHDRRVLPRPGLPRGGHGRLDLALGGSAPRALGAHGGDARRRGLSRVSSDETRRVLRARGHVRDARAARRARSASPERFLRRGAISRSP